MPNDEEFLTVDQLCALLKIGRNRAYILLSAGVIEAFRIGKSWKIPKSSVSKYVADISRDEKI